MIETQMQIYLDNNATTPMDSKVLQVMMPFLESTCGNPASRDHVFGWEAAEAIEEARVHVASLVGCAPHEIRFTSGATEGINLALKGLTLASSPERRRCVISATEHSAVLAVSDQIERLFAARVIVMPVDEKGRVDLDCLRATVRRHSPLIVVAMGADSEIGTMHPLREIAAIAHAAGAYFFSDITQVVGKVEIDVHVSGIDVAAFSAHKLYGPKGVGAVFIRDGERRIEMEPLVAGGGQERGLRGGTPFVAGIVGFGEACRIAANDIASDQALTSRLRDRLEARLIAEIEGAWVNGDAAHRLPNTTSIGFPGLDARVLLRDAHTVAASTRSACSSGSIRPSHVLKAIGLKDDQAYSCIRFSLGRFTTSDEIDRASEIIAGSARRLRSMSSGPPGARPIGAAGV